MISHRGHSDACSTGSSGIPLMAVVELELFPGGLVYFHIFLCVLALLCVGGDSHAGSLIENLFPRYSAVNKGSVKADQRHLPESLPSFSSQQN